MGGGDGGAKFVGCVGAIVRHTGTVCTCTIVHQSSNRVDDRLNLIRPSAGRNGVRGEFSDGKSLK